ncbi:MAG: fasciclin domain-containing protein [Bacteroidaceae bacterium]|nr:fasciclin domain-containing protein [Bacteroidaceae bacterium]
MKRCASLLLYSLAALGLLAGCSEDVDSSARYVFEELTAMGYLEKHADVYGTYLSLLREVPVSSRSATTLSQLLSARGHYTVFAPTNDAVLHYLESLVREGVISAPSWDAFTDSARLDSIKRVVVYNSIIDSGDNDQCYETSRFPTTEGAELPIANMNDRKLTVHYRVNYPDSLYVNRVCPISAKNRNILVLNGVVHQMEAVIAPQDITASDFFREILDCEKEGYLVMARAIQACGLLDTLRSVRDEVYEEKYQNGEVEDLKNMLNKGFTQSGNAYAPEHRKYGFTILAETDQFWREQGLTPSDPDLLTKLQQWIVDKHQYSEQEAFQVNTNFTDPDNLINLWTTNHILPEMLSTDRLVVHHNEKG